MAFTEKGVTAYFYALLVTSVIILIFSFAICCANITYFSYYKSITQTQANAMTGVNVVLLILFLVVIIMMIVALAKPGLMTSLVYKSQGEGEKFKAKISPTVARWKAQRAEDEMHTRPSSRRLQVPQEYED